MLHLDLFSGIGGFAYAVDKVWPEAEHIFCDNDRYCQAVLRKHWPQSAIWSDIRELINSHSEGRGLEESGLQQRPTISKDNQLIAHAKQQGCNSIGEVDKKCKSISDKGSIEKEAGHRQGRNSEPAFCDTSLLTGGFPCQPFSQAGKRKGKSDDRFLWPEMLECIRLFKPAWVIAENVYGLLNIQQGMVFEQVCADMEGEGYEVWPFLIPACAVNAPHRRDRIWLVAHSKLDGCNSWPSNRQERHIQGSEIGEIEEDKPAGDRRFNRSCSASDAWQNNWKQVALATCVRRVDDGIPEGMDGISGARQRTERLKMLGNSIVPQVAIEIMRAIKKTEG